MKRKLIKQGGSGLVAYIPKKWVDDKNLKAGDEISFKEEGEDLIISAQTELKKKEIFLDFKDEDPLFIMILINDLYRTGYDKMIISYSTQKQLKSITETIDKYLLGFEITEKNNDKIVLENISIPEEDKQKVLLRRIFFVLKEMFKIVEESLIKSKYEKYEELTKNKIKIGQYDNYSRRNISKKKFYQESSSFFWTLYRQIYLISHSLEHFYEVLLKNQNYKASKNNLLIFQDIIKFYSDIELGFFKKDIKLLKKINSKMNDFLYEKIHEEMKKSKSTETISLYYYGELIRLLYKMNSPILGILLKDQ